MLNWLYTATKANLRTIALFSEWMFSYATLMNQISLLSNDDNRDDPSTKDLTTAVIASFLTTTLILIEAYKKCDPKAHPILEKIKKTLELFLGTGVFTLTANQLYENIYATVLAHTGMGLFGLAALSSMREVFDTKSSTDASPASSSSSSPMITHANNQNNDGLWGTLFWLTKQNTAVKYTENQARTFWLTPNIKTH